MRWRLLSLGTFIDTRKVFTALVIMLVFSPVESDSIPGQPQQQPLYFITDFDGTIAHYDNVPSNDELADVIALPASSGSGKVAYINSDIVEKIETIKKITSSAGSAMICASGRNLFASI